ncbi:MAG TPA: hypothetical protein G4O04_02165 [Anaerolineae bacterium]|nr:hypothetical protein [Anaerolineae bacterium]HID84048.1 hypothetical protein [Anaerolineales bacterium]HIQ08037.1 hypothetical protein [Anaerolineaceae bacterium]
MPKRLLGSFAALRLRWYHFLLAGALGVLLALVFVGVAVAWYSLSYRGTTYPGVAVAGVDLSGLTPDQAAQRLSQTLTFPTTGKVTLTAPGHTWTLPPIALGFALDPQASALAAYRYGREGSLAQRIAQRLVAWQRGVNLPPVAVFNEPLAYKAVQQLAATIERPTVEAEIRIQGTEVVATPGQVGVTVDVPAVVAQLREQLPALRDLQIPLPVTTHPPEILDPTPTAEHLRAILAGPLTIDFPQREEGDPGPWTIEPQTLAAYLLIARQRNEHGARFVVQINPQPLRSFLERLTPQLQREAVRPRFEFDEQNKQLKLIQHGVEGRELDIEASLEALVQAILAGQHQVALVVNRHPPNVADDATAEELGITELVGEHTTYFYGSSAERIHNIATAAGRFHGLLVAPGEVFSMVKALGDISLDNGYAEALIIYGDRTIKGVGGGVCQVSTTLFRTVFFAGYPIVERHPHAYRVLYYEQTASGWANPKWAGLDATVYVPLVDFKFKNDTPYWILMEVQVNAPHRFITWRLYSTSDGRTVEWHTTGLQNKTDPPDPKYIENPELKPGEIRQVDWAVEGAEVTVTRIVWRNGEVRYRDEFVTHYQPWRAVCEYGPGTEGMPPKNPDPKHPCRPDGGGR